MYKTLSAFRLVHISLVPIYLVRILQSSWMCDQLVVNLYVKEIMMGIHYEIHLALVLDHVDHLLLQELAS